MAALRRIPSPLRLHRFFNSSSSLITRCQYHTSNSLQVPPFSPIESAILASASTHVPEHGFSTTSLTRGAQDAGYPAASAAILSRGPFELVRWHLVTRRLSLKNEVQFPEVADGRPGMGVGRKVRSLVLARLKGNEGVSQHWQDVS